MSHDAPPSSRIPAERPTRRHLAWILVALSYLAVAPYFPRINNPNENVRIWMTRAIVVDHTLAIDRVTADWGYVDDKAVYGGHLYSSKAPGTSFLGVPVLWLQTKVWRVCGWPAPSKRAVTFALRYLTVVPCALAFLFIFGRWVEGRARSTAARDLLTVAVGLGTLLYPYGILYMGHAQAAMLAFCAFMALGWPNTRQAAGPLPTGEAAPRTDLIPGDGPSAGSSGVVSGAPSARALMTAGALAGTAVIFEYQALLVALAVAGLAAWRGRWRSGWFALGALPPALALGAYHAVAFGRPWSFPYGHLENQTYAHLHHGSGFFGLQLPRGEALGASLFSVSYGLLVFSPFLAVGAVSLVRRALRPPRAEAIAVLSACVALILFLAGMTHWRAGWCVGPRYIAAIAPLLASGLALDWSWFAGGGGSDRAAAWRRGVLGGLVVVAVALNGLSAATYPHYPEQFDNPVFDLALPAWRDGYVPSGWGHALGLPRLFALLPVATLWAAALGVALTASDAAPRPRLGRRAFPAAVAVAVAAGALTLLSAYGRRPSSAEAHATTLVRALWDPPPQGPERPAAARGP